MLGTGGLATMWEAVFADVGVSLLATLQCLANTKDAVLVNVRYYQPLP